MRGHLFLMMRHVSPSSGPPTGPLDVRLPDIFRRGGGQLVAYVVLARELVLLRGSVDAKSELVRAVLARA